ncbi:MAG: glycosaminoglycan attachment protein, partial [Fibrobacterota bacterium]
KRYWELPHVNNNPLVLAIADFHDDQSMLWSSTALINYLYGVKHSFHHDDNGQLIIKPIKIQTHSVGEKEIPSGFYFQTDAEYISAVLFSASATISKFNRMGRQAGFKDPNVLMIRMGTFVGGHFKTRH